MTDTGRPFWFGAAEAPLFAWYHPPAAVADGDGVAGDLAVVICPPFGYEAICAHRGLRALGDTLARAGLPVVRFDYHGTGDSSGDDRQPDRVAAWLGSITAAIDEAKRLSGRAQVALVGLRLGALLATTAAAGRSDVRALVLWAPCPSGKAFLREMKMLRLTGDNTAPAARPGMILGRSDDDEEAAGFLLSASTIQALTALNLLTLDRRPAAAALVLQRDDIPDDSRLTKRLQSLGVDTREAKVPGYLALMQDPHRSVRPVAAMQAMADWLTAHGQPAPDVLSAAADHLAGAATIPAPPSGGPAVREEAVSFVAGGLRLHGIVCEPLPGAGSNGHGTPAHRRGVIMLNAGAIRRVGPNRLYVEMAREWARRGMTSLRMDLSGLGDSAGEDPVGARLYSMISVPEAQGAVKFLRDRGSFAAVTVMGLCSGAFVAFHAALTDPAIDSTVLINPQLFFWKEGTSLDVARRTSYQASQHYRQSLFKPESWAKLLRGDVDIPRVARLLGARAADVARDQMSPLLEMVRAPQDEVLTAFRASIARRINTYLIFCSTDPGLDNIQAHLGRGLRRLGPAGKLEGRVKMDTIDGPDHTFTPLWSHGPLMDLLTRHLSGL
ncbi:MAG TPA: alpha/beta hydrolase [Polyangia bacterium]|jgi:alpha-beta hydrolase superfamily lysophospholipase